MRPGPLLHFLLYTTAPIALAAPVLPLHILVEKSLNNDAISDSSSQPPADQPLSPTVTLEGAPAVLPSATHSRTALEEETVQLLIDNRPLALSPSQLPASGVLSSARPLTTEYLQALSRLQLEQAQARARAQADAEAEAQQQAADSPEPLVRRTMPVGSLVAPGASPAGGAWHVQDVVVQMDEPQAAEPQRGSPCAGKHADVVVIGMALTFVMVILMVEMWTPVSRTIRRALGSEGAIRLQEDSRTAGRHGQSFRDPDLEISELADEKGGEQGLDNGEEGEEEQEEVLGAEPWVL